MSNIENKNPTTQECSPLPLTIGEVRIFGLSEPVILDAQGHVFCKLPALSNCGGAVNVRAPQIAANANLIARAVNHHGALTGALEQILDRLDEWSLYEGLQIFGKEEAKKFRDLLCAAKREK